MQVPADFLRELKKDKNAYAFFQTLNKANTYAIAWRLQTDVTHRKLLASVGSP
jgi:hypothetical protein